MQRGFRPGVRFRTQTYPYTYLPSYDKPYISVLCANLMVLKISIGFAEMRLS